MIKMIVRLFKKPEAKKVRKPAVVCMISNSVLLRGKN